MSHRTFLPPLGVLMLALAAALPAQASSWRTFVSPNGNDANTASNCGLTTPCRQFAAALSVTDPDGEIVVLDSANYGKLAANKSVTISTPPGIYAGISVFVHAPAPTDTGIEVSGANVTLRGLTINGMGGQYGIHMTGGAKLTIENCIIANFTAVNSYGIKVDVPADVRIINTVVKDGLTGIHLSGGASAVISGSTVAGNATAGIKIDSGTAVTTTAYITDTVVTGNGTGIDSQATFAGGAGQVSVTRSTIVKNTVGVNTEASAGSATATVSNSAISENGTGLRQAAGGTLYSFANNARSDNTADDSGTISAVPALVTLGALPDRTPGQPTGVSAVRGLNSISVAFTAPSSTGWASGDPASGITGYRVVCAPDGSGTGASSPVTVTTSLTSDVAHTCTVEASNDGGSTYGTASVASNSVTPCSDCSTAPSAPTGVTAAVAGATSITVGFTAPTSLGTKADNTAASVITNGYDAICTSVDAGATTPVHATSSTASPITVTGATTGKSYTCTVTVTTDATAGSNTATSTASNAVTPAEVASAPSAPTGVTATAGTNSISVAFTASASPGTVDGGGAATITGYTAICTSSDGGATGTASGPASPLPVAGLTGAKTYTCTVTATNNVPLTSLASAPSNSVVVSGGSCSQSMGAGDFVWTTTTASSFFPTFPGVTTSGDLGAAIQFTAPPASAFTALGPNLAFEDQTADQMDADKEVVISACPHEYTDALGTYCAFPPGKTGMSRGVYLLDGTHTTPGTFDCVLTAGNTYYVNIRQYVASGSRTKVVNGQVQFTNR